ncbi:MAG TPA: GntR family transcriptional regulator [Pseudonocardiaceae bacterium]
MVAHGRDVKLRRRPQLSEEVAAHLRERIMSGQVRPGEYLRLEHVAEELGISVTPVREALVALRGEGFVQLQPRRGFIVSPLSRVDVQDVFRVQADIAGELASRAATVITDEQLENLETIQGQLDMLHTTGASVEQEALNHEFHRQINSVSESRKLAWFLATAVRYAPLSFYGEIHGWTRASREDHHAVLDALHKRDPDAARFSMHRHITHAGDLLVEHLDKLGVWSEES